MRLGTHVVTHGLIDDCTPSHTHVLPGEVPESGWRVRWSSGGFWRAGCRPPMRGGRAGSELGQVLLFAVGWV